MHEETVKVGDLVAGRFNTLREIGRGGMGTVFEATVRLSPDSPQHVPAGTTVAIKILHARHMQNREAVARFLNEGRAASSVRGENSVRVYEMTEHQGRPVIVMELLTGSDLSSVLRRGPLHSSLACLFILQACEGMAEVHSLGMVHRDLKPSNVFLTQRPDGSPLVKVLDFGIAKTPIADESQLLVQTLTAVALGPPLYMSPEQIRSSGHVDSRSDVWSLGTILYELLTGRPAFGGNTVSNITAQILERDPPPPSAVAGHLGTGFDAIMLRALAKDPAHRIQDVAELARFLEPLAGPRGEGTAARTQRWVDLFDSRNSMARRSDPGTGQAFWKDGATDSHKRKNRTLGIALVSLGALAVLLSVLAISAYRTARPPSGSQLLTGSPFRMLKLKVRSLPITTSGVPLADLPSASAGPSLPSAASPSSRNSKQSTAPRPTSKTTDKLPEPTAPAPTKPFDPFRDRN